MGASNLDLLLAMPGGPAFGGSSGYDVGLAVAGESMANPFARAHQGERVRADSGRLSSRSCAEAPELEPDLALALSAFCSAQLEHGGEASGRAVRTVRRALGALVDGQIARGYTLSRRALLDLSSALARGETAGVAAVVQEAGVRTGGDVHALIMAVLRESYFLQHELLGDLYRRLDAINRVQKAIRAKIASARKLQSELCEGDPLPADWEFEQFSSGQGETEQAEASADADVWASASTPLGSVGAGGDAAAPRQVGTPKPGSARDAAWADSGVGWSSWVGIGFRPTGHDQSRLDQGATPRRANPHAPPDAYDATAFAAYIESLEADLQSFGGDAQMMSLELQDALQKEQLALQTMSSASKLLHDTAMAIVRNLAG